MGAWVGKDLDVGDEAPKPRRVVEVAPVDHVDHLPLRTVAGVRAPQG